MARAEARYALSLYLSCWPRSCHALSAIHRIDGREAEIVRGRPQPDSVRIHWIALDCQLNIALACGAHVAGTVFICRWNVHMISRQQLRKRGKINGLFHLKEQCNR